MWKKDFIRPLAIGFQQENVSEVFLPLLCLFDQQRSIG
jgi:hypothetical protein